MIDTLQGVFTLTDVKTKTESETDKKWVVWDCVEVFILTETDTLTDVNGFQTYFIGLNLGIGICLCQCERTISLILAFEVTHDVKIVHNSNSATAHTWSQ